MMGGIIAICGVDGSGKTTQIRLLEKYLRERGFRVRYVWLRWTAFLSYPFLALCRLLGYTRWIVISGSGVRYAERRFYLNRVLARLWLWLLTLDTAIHLALRVWVWRALGYIVLCDRFIPDILVDLICETKDHSLPKRLAGRLLLSLIPKSSRLVIIDVDEEVAYSRKYDIPSIDYLRERRRIYLVLARSLGVPVINGERDVSSIHEDVLRIALKRPISQGHSVID